MELNKIHNIDCIAGLKLLADKSVHCVVTSPPYFSLRDYGMPGQIGLEDTPKKYINKMVKVFREVKRILRNDGTLWLNIGDSYNGSGKAGKNPEYMGKHTTFGKLGKQETYGKPSNVKGLKPKDLMGIPWLFAFALRADGWYLRQDIIWSKPNPMPESVTDRCTKSHEYIFLLSKSNKYYYDYQSIMQDVSQTTIGRISQDIESQIGSTRVPGKTNGNMKASWNGSTFDKGKTGIMKETNGFLRKSGNKQRKNGSERGCPEGTGSNVCGSVPWEGLKANKRSVWTVTTKPFTGSHFAVFPEDLILDCIKAGCPADGIVLDPFMGAGTTALVAQKLGRNFIGFELNPKYVTMANKRLNSHLGMFSPENLKAIEQSSNQLTIG